MTPEEMLLRACFYGLVGLRSVSARRFSWRYTDQHLRFPTPVFSFRAGCQCLSDIFSCFKIAFSCSSTMTAAFHRSSSVFMPGEFLEMTKETHRPDCLDLASILRSTQQHVSFKTRTHGGSVCISRDLLPRHTRILLG